MNTRLPAVFCFLVATAAPLLAAEAPPAPVPVENGTVVLPPLVVPGEFSAEGWVYTRIDHTEFLSQCPAKETRVFADDFATFRVFVQARYSEAALPADLRVTVVLCNSTAGFRGFGGSADKTSTTLAASSGLILIDADQLTLEQFIKAGRRRLVALGFQQHPAGRYPLWRELGTREILANILIRDNRLEIGYPPFFPAGTGAPDFTQFNSKMPLPMAELFTVTRQSPGYGGKDDGKFWDLQMQSTAFMHLCLFGARYQRFREPFRKFITRLETEPFSEKLFQNCFDMNPGEMHRWLRSYAVGDAGMKYETQRYKISPTPPFEVRPARPAEVLRLVRECRRLQEAAAKSN